MEAVLAAKIWHWWIAWPITIGAILTVLAVAVGYLVKVSRLRYPPDDA